MEMKVAVIGAGISGLAIAEMLKKDGAEVTVFERENRVGGLIKCRRINGCLFHQTGGHVFNTKYNEVADWFWAHFDKDNEFTKAARNSTIAIDNDFISYPIENHIYQLNADIQKDIIENLLELAGKQHESPNNFEEFLQQRFGQKLYDIYFKPYNHKIWRKDLSTVPLEWLEGKLPMPTVQELLFNNFNHIKEKTFVHSTFFYPKEGGSQFIADRLSQGTDIRLGTNIETLKKEGSQWDIKNEKFDKIIFCGNIKALPSMLESSILPAEYTENIEKLEGHGTTAVFCYIDKNEFSWIYQPSKEHESHRIICTGNFATSNNCDEMYTASIEFTDYISKEDIIENLAKIPYNPRYVDHHYEKYTYPIQNADTRKMISDLKTVLEEHGMYLLGRFAEWEYYNMDAAIHAAMQLKARL